MNQTHPMFTNPSLTQPLLTGFTRAQLTEVCELKNLKRGRLSELSGMSGATYHAGKSVWQLGKEIVGPPECVGLGMTESGYR